VKIYHPLDQSLLYKVTTRRKLAAIFGMNEAALQSIVAMPQPFSARDKEITRNGVTKIRHIQEPRGSLRPIHNRVRRLLSRIEPPSFLFCPVKGRCYVSNAALHAGAKEIRKLDIQKYFPSTPDHRVFWFFNKVMQCSRDVAAILAKLLTADGHLATGSTVSPILSYYAFRDMWLNIADIAHAAGCTLSVYIDDLNISGERVSESVMWKIRQQVHSRGLGYHKERHFRDGKGEVTGVFIRDGKVLLPNRQRKKVYDLRAALRQAKDQAEADVIRRRLQGLLTQQKQIQGYTPSREIVAVLTL
jgi:hypothetical protein